MDTRIKQLGLSLGVAAVFAVGYIATSGQYVPPVNRANTVSTVSTCSPGERPEWDGSAWQCRGANDYRGKHLEWTDEFMSAANLGNGATIGSGLYTVVTNGTAANATSQVSGIAGTQRPGIYRFNTGSTSTGTSGAYSSLAAIDFGTMSSSMFEFTGGWQALSTSGDEETTVIGFFDTASGPDSRDGCYFLYDRGNVATAMNTGGLLGGDVLDCVCANNNTRTGYPMNGSAVSDGSFTTVNTPVGALTLPDTNMYTLRVVVTGTSKAEFYVAGNASSGVLTKRCEISTNIPASSGRAFGAGFNITKSSGTTSQGLYVDRTRLSLDLTAARSP